MHTSPNRIDVEIATLRRWQDQLRGITSIVVNSGNMTAIEKIALHKRVKLVREGIDNFLQAKLPDVVVRLPHMPNGDSAPMYPTIGAQIIDHTDGGSLKVWNGTTWVKSDENPGGPSWSDFPQHGNRRR